jgi:hypothetical protein
LYASRSKR